MIFKEKIKDNKKVILILLAIMIAGIFLRTWHYSEIMRFGKDQARDATIIRDIINNEDPLPLLGPKAGGTEYKMGPIFYYFQYTSAKIFGVEPDKMAYPDLLLSILTIPLLFLFLRLYFNRKLSLALTALFAVSFFAVQNGRFAWNPNSLPFFSILFLYSFSKLADLKQNKNIKWAILTGVALGVGIQLHTLYIIIFGIVFVIFSIYLMKNRILNFKNVAIIFFVVLFLNLPQIISEVKTGGENTKSFFVGITQKSEKKNPFPRNFLVTAEWQIQANTMFVYPAGDDSNPQIEGLLKKIEKNKKGLMNAIFVKYLDMSIRLFIGALLSIAGYFLLGYYIKKESDKQKRFFLQLLAVYMIVSFLILIPLSHVLILRYFLILQFVPLLLLGLVIKFLEEKFGQKILYASIITILIFGGINFYLVVKELNSFHLGDGDVQIAIWSEEKFAGEFILKNSKPNQKIYFVYEPQNANKFIRSLAYFNENIDAPIIPNDGTPLEEKNVSYFSLIINDKKEINKWKRKIDKSNYKITNESSFGRVAIYKLELISQ